MDTSLGAFPDIDWLKSKLPKAKVIVRSNNRNVQAQMSSAGVGIAVLPRPVGDKQPNLQRLDLGEDPPGRDIWMGYHRDIRRSGRLRAFVELAVASSRTAVESRQSRERSRECFSSRIPGMLGIECLLQQRGSLGHRAARSRSVGKRFQDRKIMNRA